MQYLKHTSKLQKNKSKDLKKLGIWKRVNSSPWTAATFVQPKKTGDIRVLTDFRKLNEWIVAIYWENA